MYGKPWEFSVSFTHSFSDLCDPEQGARLKADGNWAAVVSITAPRAQGLSNMNLICLWKLCSVTSSGWPLGHSERTVSLEVQASYNVQGMVGWFQQGSRDSLGWRKVVTERGRQPVAFSEVTQESLLKVCSKDHMGRARDKWTLIRELRFQAYCCEALSSWHVSTLWVQPKILGGIAVFTGQRLCEEDVEVALEERVKARLVCLSAGNALKKMFPIAQPTARSSPTLHLLRWARALPGSVME